MSTFSGYLAEFPDIRIDRFVQIPGKASPLAGFLSHVHSDHLLGLASLKAPFVYCSSATREMVLRLEKYPHRINFAKGIIETRKQTYKHLHKLLKPLPLNSPATIELSPGNQIQVTLLDANHCLGAVIFLIEGGGKAILYTGDVRAESWWINALLRNPNIIEYTGERTLDMVYLDTTFAATSDCYRAFPSKAQGLQELVDSVAKYPNNTTFYFNAWTFGYEEVWMTLAKCLGTRVHLDQYRHRIYTSVAKLANAPSECPEAPSLCGFSCGNRAQPGILTRNADARLHSCEKGSGCPTLIEKAQHVVEITPIISRHAGVEMRETGAGGGHGDLDQAHELDLSNPKDVEMLVSLCKNEVEEKDVMQRIVEMLRKSTNADGQRHCLNQQGEDSFDYGEAFPLTRIPWIMARLARTRPNNGNQGDMSRLRVRYLSGTSERLPRSITFPYSRHSSYVELRELLMALKPRDVWPCTTVPVQEWKEEMSMQAMFGDIIKRDAQGFAFDRSMRQAVADQASFVTVDEFAEEDRCAAVETQRPSQVNYSSGPRESMEVFHDASLEPKATTFQPARNDQRPETNPLKALPSPEPWMPSESSKLHGSRVVPRASLEGHHTKHSVRRSAEVYAAPWVTRRAKDRLWLRQRAVKAASRGTWQEDVRLLSTNPSERTL